MKKILLVISLILSLFFVACNNNPNDSNSSNQTNNSSFTVTKNLKYFSSDTDIETTQIDETISTDMSAVNAILLVMKYKPTIDAIQTPIVTDSYTYTAIAAGVPKDVNNVIYETIENAVVKERNEDEVQEGEEPYENDNFIVKSTISGDISQEEIIELLTLFNGNNNIYVLYTKTENQAQQTQAL